VRTRAPCHALEADVTDETEVFIRARIRAHIIRLAQATPGTIIDRLVDLCVKLYKGGKTLPFGPSLN
jgi:hypothetical protein